MLIASIIFVIFCAVLLFGVCAGWIDKGTREIKQESFDPEEYWPVDHDAALVENQRTLTDD